MQESGFFTSQQLPDGSYDRARTAEDFAYYFSKFIGNGVYITPATQLQVSQTSDMDMRVNVAVGDAYINGWYYKNTTVVSLPISIATGSMDRIDAVVLRWSKLNRNIVLAIVEGTPAADAQPPVLTRDENTYELCLARINVKKTITSITNSLIVDTRSNSELCGYVHGVVDQIDATNLFQQFTAIFNEWYDNLQKSGNDAMSRFEALIRDSDTRFNDMLTMYGTQAQQFLMDRTNEFETWFETIKGRLSGDIAANLASAIADLEISNKEVTDNVTSILDDVAEVKASNDKKANAAVEYNVNVQAWSDTALNGAKFMYTFTDNSLNLSDDDGIILSLNKNATITADIIKSAQAAQISFVKRISATQIGLFGYGSKPTIVLPFTIGVVKSNN